MTAELSQVPQPHKSQAPLLHSRWRRRSIHNALKAVVSLLAVGLLFECLVGHVFISVRSLLVRPLCSGCPKALRCLSSVTGSRRRGVIDQNPALRQHCETSAVTKLCSSRSSSSISIEGAPLTRAMKVDLLPDAPPFPKTKERWAERSVPIGSAEVHLAHTAIKSADRRSGWMEDAALFRSCRRLRQELADTGTLANQFSLMTDHLKPPTTTGPFPQS